MDRPPRADAPRTAAAKRVCAAARGYDRQWSKTADREIAADPFCTLCGKTYPRRNMVRDHIIPHRGNQQLFDDPSNRQTLCRWCHAVKSAAE